MRSGASSQHILDDATPLYTYDPGTWGPEEAEPADRRRRSVARPAGDQAEAKMPSE